MSTDVCRHRLISTPAPIGELPTVGQRRTVNLETTFQELGISRRVGYELARRNQLPVPVIRIGRRMVVSREALDALLAPRSTNAA
jgi:predicted DNA-binding transcriptional regulator AlpA